MRSRDAATGEGQDPVDLNNSNQQGDDMIETLIAVGVIAGLAAWAYKNGKREGSRGGFAAGKRRRQNNRR